MKRAVFSVLLAATLLISGVTAMNVSAASSDAAVSAQTTGTPPAELGTLSTETKLIAGIYSLYGTTNAITAEQAASLKTLFESYLALNQSSMPTPSGTAQAQATPDANATPEPRQMPTVSAETQAQMDALLTQIQAVLTSTQLSAIEALNLTPQTAMEVIMKYGGMGGGPGGQGQAQGTPSANGQPGGQPPSGNGQQPQAQGTPQAGGQGQPGNGGGPGGGMGGGMGGGSQMIEAFITFLTNVSTGTPVTTQAAPAAPAA